MDLRRFDIWLADLKPSFGTEPGKTRPVVIVQTDLLNNKLDSTVVLPITSKVNTKMSFLRVYIPKGNAGLEKDSDILIDQFRAIDNKRLVQKLGILPVEIRTKLEENIKIVLDL